MAAAGWTFDRLDLLAAGRGPGNYSGLRSALTVVQALALPADQPVFAVSSGKILATALAREFPDVSRFAIAGDARRRHLWLGLFERDASVLSMITDWQLLAPGDFAARVPADTLIASPEFERLKEGGLLAPDVFETFQWIPENRFPDAGTLAALACARQGRDSEPVTPVYMHPPVATPPRS
jgi:tRNA threonylcarbamoyladenosine biosynthesis protein TsaB